MKRKLLDETDLVSIAEAITVSSILHRWEDRELLLYFSFLVPRDSWFTEEDVTSTYRRASVSDKKLQKWLDEFKSVSALLWEQESGTIYYRMSAKDREHQGQMVAGLRQAGVLPQGEQEPEKKHISATLQSLVGTLSNPDPARTGCPTFSVH
jgi:hypothetical protein